MFAEIGPPTEELVGKRGSSPSLPPCHGAIFPQPSTAWCALCGRALCGTALWHGIVWHGNVWHGTYAPGTVWWALCGMSLCALVRCCTALCGMAHTALALYAGHCVVWYSVSWYCVARHCVVWHWLAWHVSPWHCVVWHCVPWHHTASQGVALQSQGRCCAMLMVIVSAATDCSLPYIHRTPNHFRARPGHLARFQCFMLALALEKRGAASVSASNGLRTPWKEKQTSSTLICEAGHFVCRCSASGPQCTSICLAFSACPVMVQ